MTIIIIIIFFVQFRNRSGLFYLSIITQVNIKIPVLWLVEKYVIWRYNHLPASRPFWKMAARRFVDVSEEEINIMKENAIPKSTKEANKFGVTLLQYRI